MQFVIYLVLVILNSVLFIKMKLLQLTVALYELYEL